MPARREHGFGDPFNEAPGDVAMKEVAHGIDEDHSRLAPAQRVSELLRDKADVEALHEGMAFDSAKALGEAFSVAVLAAWADPGAAADWIPGGVGPFDFGEE